MYPSPELGVSRSWGHEPGESVLPAFCKCSINAGSFLPYCLSFWAMKLTLQESSGELVEGAHLGTYGSTSRHVGRVTRLPRAPGSPTVGPPWGVSIDLSSAGLEVWTLAGPTAWQHQALAAQ